MASQPENTPKARKELEDPTLQVAEPNGITPESAPPERARKVRDETADPRRIRFARDAPESGRRHERTGNQGLPKCQATAPPSDSRAVPEHVSARYIKVGNKYHFPNGDLAFADRGRGLSTRLENTEVIRDLIAIAKERGWNEIALRGTERFRKEAWQQAKLAGLAVRGYRPSELERAQLARLIARERDAGPSAPSTELFGRLRAIREAARGGRRSGSRRGASQRSRRPIACTPADSWIMAPRTTGTTVTRISPTSSKIDTPDGERTLWGKDLERAARAIALSGEAGR